MAAPTTFRIIPVAPFLGVMEDGVGIISEGQDLRDEREALAFIGDIARERGLAVNVIRSEGAIERIEANPDPSLSRFTMRSLREIEGLKDQLSSALRRLAAQHASQSGRPLVEAQDVRDVVSAAVSEILRQIAEDKAGR